MSQAPTAAPFAPLRRVLASLMLVLPLLIAPQARAQGTASAQLFGSALQIAEGFTDQGQGYSIGYPGDARQQILAIIAQGMVQADERAMARESADPGMRAYLLAVIAAALSAAGEGDAGAVLAEEAIAIAGNLGQDMLLDATLSRASLALSGAGQRERARAIAMMITDGDDRATAFGGLAQLLTGSDLQAELQEVRGTDQPMSHDRLLAMIMFVGPLVADGQTDLAMEISLGINEPVPGVTGRTMALTNAALAAVELGDFDLAIRITGEVEYAIPGLSILSQVGAALVESDQPALAAPLFTEALIRFGDPEVSHGFNSGFLRPIVTALSDLGDEEVEAMHLRLRRTIRGNESDRHRAELLALLAVEMVELNRPEWSNDYFTEAAQAAISSRFANRRAEAFASLAISSASIGDTRGSQLAAQRALDLAQKLDDSTANGIALVQVSRALLAAGETGTAVQTVSDALDMAGRIAPDVAAFSIVRAVSHELAQGGY